MSTSLFLLQLFLVHGKCFAGIDQLHRMHSSWESNRIQINVV